MANLRLSRFVLNDKWPGPINFNIGIPNRSPNSKCGWDNTYDNFTTADETARALNKNHTQRIGEKRAFYHDSTDCPGWVTMMYLCYHSFCKAATGDFSKDFSDGNFWCSVAGLICQSTSEWADTSVGPYFVVTKCYTGSDVTKTGILAVPCSTHIKSDGTVVNTQGYGDGYGWFWVGGPCPCKDITLFDDETGDGKGVDITCAVGRGPVMAEVTGGTAWLMATDMSDLADATNFAGVGRDMAGLLVGWTCDSAA